MICDRQVVSWKHETYCTEFKYTHHTCRILLLLFTCTNFTKSNCYMKIHYIIIICSDSISYHRNGKHTFYTVFDF